MTNFRQTKVDRAHSALRDLAGLIPAKDRKTATEEIEVLLNLITDYGRMESHLREVKIWVDRASNSRREVTLWEARAARLAKTKGTAGGWGRRARR